MQDKAIKTTRYLTTEEIQEHLNNVEYVVMAAPSPDAFKETPVHLTVFLNTSEVFDAHIKEMIFEKFCIDHKITKTDHVMSQLMPVGFSETTHDTPMPLLLVKPEDQMSIPNIPLHVIDFLCDTEEFNEVKEKSLTGWSYVYES